MAKSLSICIAILLLTACVGCSSGTAAPTPTSTTNPGTTAPTTPAPTSVVTTPATYATEPTTGGTDSFPTEYNEIEIRSKQNDILLCKEIVPASEYPGIAGTWCYSVTLPQADGETISLLGADGNRRVYLVKDLLSDGMHGRRSVEIGYCDLETETYQTIKENEQTGILFLDCTDQYMAWAECDRSEPQHNPVIHVLTTASGHIDVFTLPHVEGRDFSIHPLFGQYAIIGDHLYHVVVETLDAQNKADRIFLYDYDITTGEDTCLGQWGLYPHDNRGKLGFFRGKSLFTLEGETVVTVADTIKRDTNNFSLGGGVYAWNEQVLDLGDWERSIPDPIRPYVTESYWQGFGVGFHADGRTGILAVSLNDGWIGGPCTDTAGEVIAFTSGGNPPMLYDIALDTIVALDADPTVDWFPYRTDNGFMFLHSTAAEGGPTMSIEAFYVDLAED